MTVPGTITDQLNELIIGDASLDTDLFERLLAQQHDLGLLQGDRPTCPFLRPHILSRSKYETIKESSAVIANAFEKVVHQALTEPRLLKVLEPTPAEEEMARLDPGYSRLCVSSRLDSYLTHDSFKFLEYNAESPAGVGDQMQLEKVLFDLPNTRRFLDENKHWRPQPHQQLLGALITAYRDWGGQVETPQIAIVDWEGVPTRSEFRILQKYFEESGHPTVIVDPNDLSYVGGELRADKFRIDVLYKRVIIHEYLNRFDREHPLARAYVERRVCMANSFRAKLAHKKSGFAILSDPQYSHLFDAAEREQIQQHIPWTRRVAAGVTQFENHEVDLITLLQKERERFVLKPNDDYGGHGVFLGWETSRDDWHSAIKLALKTPYVAQERAPVDKVVMPMFAERVTLEEMFVDFNPFLFHNEVEGALIRLSRSSLLNVTSGGGQTALVVLEDT